MGYNWVLFGTNWFQWFPHVYLLLYNKRTADLHILFLNLRILCAKSDISTFCIFALEHCILYRVIIILYYKNSEYYSTSESIY